MEETISIVIPIYNQWSLCHQLLMDIKRHCKYNLVDVVTVDDASPNDDVAGGINFWRTDKLLPIRHHRSTVNRGFVHSSNAGLRHAKGDIIILLSTDVRIYSEHFFSEIVTELREHPLALVGPKLYTGDTGWNKIQGKIYPYLEGWALAARETTWNILGGFDERYAPSDFEDVDLSTAVLHHGWPLRQIRTGLCEHLGGKSYGYNPEREARTKRNQKLFEEKWCEKQ